MSLRRLFICALLSAIILTSGCGSSGGGSASSGTVGDAPTALCNDGTYSYSANKSGTCSSHGGVKTWLK